MVAQLQNPGLYFLDYEVPDAPDRMSFKDRKSQATRAPAWKEAGTWLGIPSFSCTLHTRPSDPGRQSHWHP